ncbi:MAG: hypothetical protein L6R40_005813 [Gallowayella cf. fulva]|nr:MAG: hypothetical protein L6R40_005813 [Xanthomendoza cf. fulva]
MSEPRRSSRRLSARLGDKEDAPLVNGVAHGKEKAKGGQSSGSGTRQAISGVNGTTSGAKGKRKLDYDEDSDGFKFTRTRAKKAKAGPAPQIPPIEEDKHEDSPMTSTVKKTRKRISGSPKAAATENKDKPERRRRSPRNSGDKDPAAEEEPPLPTLEVKKKRKPRDDGPHETRKSSKRHDQAAPAPSTTSATEPNRTQPVDTSFDPIKVSLPFADTPIIRRNKEMRKGVENGSRRSSLGQRGRRASSLIDSGKSDALPHEEVESVDFYKHIESSLTEPRRMKQLLTWCGTRALGEKPSSTLADFHGRQAAREIQQLLLKDFSTKSEMSDWFNRKENTPPPQRPRPHPKNVSNENRIKELEQELAKLQTDRQTWETLLRPPPSDSLALSPLTKYPEPQSISADLLADPSQASALSSLLSPTKTGPNASSPETQSSSTDLQASTLARLQSITSDNNLEFTIDTFATNIHALNSYQQAADRVATALLSISAEALEEREKQGRRRDGDGGEAREVGMRDVLRGLSRVI